MTNGGRTRRIAPALAAGAMALLLGAAAVYNIPIPMERTISAVEIRLDDPDYAAPRQIHLSGTYHVNLFSPDAFYGHIAVSGYAVTEKVMAPVLCTDRGANLTYYFEEIGTLEKTVEFGYLFADRGMRNLCICMVRPAGNGGTWDAADGRCIVSAPSRGHAVALLRAQGVPGMDAAAQRAEKGEVFV